MQDPTPERPDFAPDLSQFARHDEGLARERAIEAHRLAFNGDGGVYFGVWFVNVLLSILTLGLYTPWARRRTIRYFYGHTLIDGSPLEFTAGIRSMVFGFLLFAAIYIAFNVSAETGQFLLYLLILGATAALSPWLWGSAMRFRLHHTRWRGLRLRFTARWGEVYRASWPMFALLAIWLAAGAAMQGLIDRAEPPRTGSKPATLMHAAPAAEADAEADADAETASEHGDDAVPPRLPRPTWAMGALVLGTALMSLLCFIRLEFNYKRLLVQRAALGTLAGRWHPRFGDFVRVWAATLGWFALTLAGLATLAAAGVGVLALLGAGTADWLGDRSRAAIGLLVIVGMFIGFFALFFASAPALAYREARMFQLLWNQAGLADRARFRTDLRAGAFVALRVKNVLLNLITFGFYRPFARVAEYRMKTDSVTLHVKGGLATLVGELEAQQKEGFGDAVADALGLDLIG